MLRFVLAFVVTLITAQAADFLPVGVWYGGGKARAPMLEPAPRSKKELWRKDVKQIRALGFNTIRAWIDWASGEPAEKQYRFDTLDVLAELAEEEGLRLFVQVYMDSAPAWVGRKYPDSLFVSSNGQAIQPESSPGYCLDHPGVRQADSAFYRALAAHMKQYKAFLGWDLWSEPHVINWATPTYISNPEFCFCKYTVGKFRRWLAAKYSTVDALNNAWYRRFQSFDDVEPGRMSTILSYTDYIDWKAFIVDKLGQDLRSRYEAVKAETPSLPATSHAAGVGLFASPHWWEGQSDDWVMSRQVDYYGTSFYPKHSSFVDRDPGWRAALLDFTRSFGFASGRPGFFIGELQSGFGTIALNVSPTVTANDLRTWAWSALARGAKGINFYAWYPMSTGYESGGFGMIELDGTVTERARAAGEVAHIVDQHQQLFLDARPEPAQVAVVYNPLAHFVGGRQRAAAYGGPQGEVAGIERDSLLGIHRALWRKNIPIDYVHAAHLTVEELSNYKLVYLPYSPMLPETAAPVLTEYVRRGGALVGEARTGWNSERGRASDVIPGLGLHELFGARESDVQTGLQGRTKLLWDNKLTLPGRWYEETLAPTRPSSKVRATFAGTNRAAAVESTFGSGKTLLLGSYLSAAYQSTPTPESEQFFSSLLDWSGVKSRLTLDAEGVEIQALRSANSYLLFLINHTASSSSINVHMPQFQPRKVEDISRISGSKMSIRASENTIPVELKPYDARVLVVQ